MAATSWIHEVPWQADVQQALDELCNGIFESGSYRQMWMEYPETLESWEAMFEGFEPVPGFNDSIEAIQNGGQPSSIDVAEILNMESGFGGVLDCRVVATKPEFQAVSPLSDESAKNLFQSTKPLTTSIRQVEDVLMELRELARGEGRYLIGFDVTGAPESIFFFGYSGD
jgi:hypothetical protein